MDAERGDPVRAAGLTPISTRPLLSDNANCRALMKHAVYFHEKRLLSYRGYTVESAGGSSAERSCRDLIANPRGSRGSRHDGDA